MTLIYQDARFAEHNTGRHPENARRLVPITQQLEELREQWSLPIPTWEPATIEQLASVHSLAHIQEVKAYAEAGGGQIEQDTVVSPRSYEVALLAAGAAIDAVRRVVQGEAPSAFCLIRPPGHHAIPKAPMGFCLFNNVAIAAQVALKEFGLERVLIVDWDVHHGNGTQDTFWENPQVGFYSIHRFPFYPGSGAADETGTGDALGTTKNVPVAFGTSRPDFRAKFRNTLQEFADKMRPELIFISAGFDAHTLDPIGSLGLESEDFDELTQIVREIAQHHCQGKIVSLLEGGYNPQALGESIVAHIRALADD